MAKTENTIPINKFTLFKFLTFLLSSSDACHWSHFAHVANQLQPRTSTTSPSSCMSLIILCVRSSSRKERVRWLSDKVGAAVSTCDRALLP